MKLGILGGTFSPVHNGHIRWPRPTGRRWASTQVLLIPTHIPPHKTAPDLPDGEHRCRMAELACEEVQGLASPTSSSAARARATPSTPLEELHRLYPEAELYLLMGSDMFRTVLTWHRAGDLIRLATVCTMERGTDTPSELETQAERIRQSGGEACVIHAAPLDVSSSGIRAAIAAGERDPGTLGLSPRVLSYILQNSLYGTDETGLALRRGRLRRPGPPAGKARPLPPLPECRRPGGGACAHLGEKPQCSAGLRPAPRPVQKSPAGAAVFLAKAVARPPSGCYNGR